jgi:hypothetical protein
MAAPARSLYLLARLRLGPPQLGQGLVEFSFFHFHLTRMITGLAVPQGFRRPERALTRSSRFQDEKFGRDFHTRTIGLCQIHNGPLTTFRMNAYKKPGVRGWGIRAVTFCHCSRYKPLLLPLALATKDKATRPAHLGEPEPVKLSRNLEGDGVRHNRSADVRRS